MMRALLAVLTLLLGSASAWASGGSEWSSSESGRVRLISAVAATGEAPTLRLGLQFQLQPGWKIYWRSPGDAGYPPKIDWTGSANLGAPAILWPAPHRFVLSGLQNHGYVGEVVLPLDAPLLKPGQPASFRASVEFLACAQVCVPQKADLALDLPAGPATATAFAHDISRFAAQIPGDGRAHGLSLDKAEAIGEGEASVLRLTLVSAAEPFDQPDAFVEAEDVAGFGQPRLSLSPDRRRAVLSIPVSPGTVLKPLAGQSLRVTVADGLRSMEAVAVPVVSTAPEPQSSEAPSLLAMIAAALLGGLILNLMPCVLPVLSIKLLGILGHGGAERAHARASFLASSAGILASFLALAALAVGLKQAGQAVGWGIQFQQPGFLAAMVVLLGLFAVNLWGAFEINLPSWLMTKAGSGSHHTVAGHFLSGAFATLLATPCSAPFLGTAIGFALARGPAEIFAIFAALGLGMASPFLAVAIWPDAALRMPRPGAWMIRARKVMGLALAATALWLLSVLAIQTSVLAALISGSAVALAGGLAAAKPRLGPQARGAVWPCVIVLAALAVVAPFHAGEDARAADKGGRVAWIAFDQAALPRLIGEGKTVFVDVTADWCITCKVNKAAVVERGEVAKRLGGDKMVAMKADWTRPDESISRYLASFGRYGIPFNVVYGPAAPDGLPLSELLTESEVLAALDKAAGVGR